MSDPLSEMLNPAPQSTAPTSLSATPSTPSTENSRQPAHWSRPLPEPSDKPDTASAGPTTQVTALGLGVQVSAIEAGNGDEPDVSPAEAVYVPPLAYAEVPVPGFPAGPARLPGPRLSPSNLGGNDPTSAASPETPVTAPPNLGTESGSPASSPPLVGEVVAQGSASGLVPVSEQGIGLPPVASHGQVLGGGGGGAPPLDERQRTWVLHRIGARDDFEALECANVDLAARKLDPIDPVEISRWRDDPGMDEFITRVRTDPAGGFRGLVATGLGEVGLVLFGLLREADPKVRTRAVTLALRTQGLLVDTVRHEDPAALERLLTRLNEQTVYVPPRLEPRP